MVMKLQRAGATAPAETGERKAPAGWGAPKPEAAVAPPASAPPPGSDDTRRTPAGWGRPADAAPIDEAQTQRAEIQEKLNPAVEQQVHDETVSADRAFSENVIALKSQLEGNPQEVVREQLAALNALADSVADNPLPDLQAPATRRRNTDDPTRPGITLAEIEKAVHAALDSRAGQVAGPYEEAQRANWQLVELLNGAKAAGDAVVSIATLNYDAAASTYDMLFGAIEARLLALGYVAAVDKAA